MDDSARRMNVAEMVGSRKNIFLSIIFVFLTCGFYSLYWQYTQMRFVNTMLGEEKFNFGLWFLFTLLTCSLYHHYHEYVMGREIVKIQESLNQSKSADLPTLSIILSIFSFGIITDAIQQHEINQIIHQAGI